MVASGKPAKSALVQFLEQQNFSSSYKPLNMGTSDAGYSADQDGSDQDFLSWLGDIASRPLFAATETISSVADVFDPREGMNPFEAAGHVVSAPFRGFFSTNPEDKIYTGDLIEKVTDIAGYNTDPDYVDRKDNVDPIAKGVIGFIGDVGLDPLTYVGLGAVKTAATGVAKAGAKIAEAVPAVGNAASAVSRAAQKVMPAIRKADEAVDTTPIEDVIKAADESSVVDEVATKAMDDALPTTRVEPDELPETMNPDKVTDPKFIDYVAKHGNASLRDVINKTPVKAHTITEEIGKSGKFREVKVMGGKKAIQDAIKDFQGPTPLAVVADVVDSAPREFDDWVLQVEKLMENGGIQPKVTVEDVVPGVRNPDKDVTVKRTIDMRDVLNKKAALLGAAPSPALRAAAGKKLAAQEAKLAEFEARVAKINDELDAIGNSKDPAAIQKGEQLLALLDKGNDAIENLSKDVAKSRKIAEGVPGSAVDPEDSAEIMADLEAVYDRYVSKFTDDLGTDVVSLFGTRFANTEGALDAVNSYRLAYQLNKDTAVALFGQGLANVLRNLPNATFESDLNSFMNIMARDGIIDPGVALTAEGRMLETDAMRRQIMFINRIGVDYESFQKVMATSSLRAQVSPVTAATTVGESVDDFFELTENLVGYYGLKNVAQLEAITKVVTKAIESVADRNMNMKKLVERYKFESGTGAKQSSDEFGMGIANVPTAANTHTQLDLYLSVGRDIFDTLKAETKLQGKELIKARGSLGIAAMRMAEDWFSHHGIKFHIDSPATGNTYMLSITDIFEVIAKDSSNEKDYYAFVSAFFNASAKIYDKSGKLLPKGKGPTGTGSPITKYLDAVAVALDGGGRDDVLAMLRSTNKRNNPKLSPAEAAAERLRLNAIDPDSAGVTKIDNFLAMGQRDGVAGFLPNKDPNGVPSIEGTILKAKPGKKGAYIAYNANTLANILTDGIVAHTDELASLAESNLKAFMVRSKADGFVIAKKTLKEVTDVVNSGKVAESLLKVLNLSRDTAVNAAKAGASATGHAMGDEIVQAAVGPQVQATAKASVAKSEAQVKAGKAKTPAEKKAAAKAQRDANEEHYENGQKLADDNLDEAKAMAEAEELPPEIADEVLAEANLTGFAKQSSDVHAGIKGTIATMLMPVRKAFVANTGVSNEVVDMFEVTRQAGNLARTVISSRTAVYRELGRKYGHMLDSSNTTTVLQQALRNIQKGATAANPEVAAAMKELEPILDTLFTANPNNKTAVLGNAFFRTNPGSIEYLNRLMKKYDILTSKSGKSSPEARAFNENSMDYFDIQKATEKRQKLAKKGEEVDLMSLAAEQWRDWPIDDVVDFLEKANVVMLHAATDLATSASLSKIGLKAGFASKTAKDGFVKLEFKPNGRFDGVFDDTLYFDKEAADMLYRLDDMLSTSTGFNGKVGQFFRDIYDPMQNGWQFAITQLRPGHHIRNGLGNESITYLSEGVKYNLRATRDAAKMLAVFGKYDDVDMLRFLENMGETVAPRAGEVFSRGHYGDMTLETAAEAWMSLGMKRTARVIDDIWEDEANIAKFGRGVRKVTMQDTKLGEIAGSVSEAIDTHGRSKHFMQIIHKEQNAKVKRFKTQQELFEYAAKRVQKFHPDSSTLTAFERKYMRRIFPFYSWTRGAIPAMLEVALLHPGRVTSLNKASYNLAIATGVNPDSLYDPFPEDQMFPSFLTDKVQGPQIKLGGKYYAVSPGIISWDLPNTFLADPFRGTLGSISPLLRVPLEAISGTAFGTGAKIRDASDYLDSNIPGINYLASMSGYSPTGSIASMLQGMGMDPMAQVAAGNRTPLSQGLSALNYLTGLGVTEYSKPNYINYAEIEKRDREAVKTRSGF